MSDTEPLEYGQERPRKWVTVASFSDSGMANVAKLQLDAEEIPNYLDNENAAMMLWHMQPAVGWVGVKVPEEFEEQARYVLGNDERDEGDQDESGYDYGDPGLIAYADTTRCPKCQSNDTEPFSWRWRMVQAFVILIIGGMLHPLLLILLAGYAVWFIFTKPSHHCLRCRCRFNATAVNA